MVEVDDHGMTMTDLLPPSAAHATCAWCLLELPGLIELLDHVDADHLDQPPPAGR